MASENVAPWISDNADLVRGRVLEVGARRYDENSTIPLRETFPRVESFVGIDLEPGDGVDLVVDLRDAFPDVDSRLGGVRFDTIFCISVLEHIDDIFTAARNIQDLMAPGGCLFLSVPLVFRIHGYPGDFWRLTPDGVRFLFRGLDFGRCAAAATMSTLAQGECKQLPMDPRKINRFMFRPRDRADKIARKQTKQVILAGGSGVVPEYSLAPTMINMIAVKPRDA